MSIIIRLQNLPLEANSLDIRRFFQGLHIPDGGVHIVGGENGDAFIAFGSDEDARQAMERNGNVIKNSRIKLLLSSRNEMQKVIDNARNQSKGISAVPGAGVGRPPAAGPPVAPAPLYGSQQGQFQSGMPTPQSIPPKPIISGPTGPYGQMYPGSQGPPAPSAPNVGYAISQPLQPSPQKGPLPTDPYRQQPPPFRSRSRSRSPPPPRMPPVDQGPPLNPVQSMPPLGNMQSGLMGALPQQVPPPQQTQMQPQQFGQNGSYAPANANPMQSTQPPPQVSYDNNNSNNNYYQQQPQQRPYSQPGPGNDDRWNSQPSNNVGPMMGQAQNGPIPQDNYRQNEMYRNQSIPPPVAQQQQNSYPPQTQQQQQMPPPYQQAQSMHPNDSIPPQSQIPPMQQQQQQQPPGRLYTLQLWNLPLSTRTIDLNAFFQPLYLYEENIKIFNDDRGFPTGVALVRFSSLRDFDTALGYNGRYMNERQIQVRPLDEMNNGAPNNQQPPPNQNPVQSPGEPFMDPNYPPGFRNSPGPTPDVPYTNTRGPAMPNNNGPAFPPHPQVPNKDLVVYMKGLPFTNCTPKDVEDFFQPIRLANIEIERDNRGKPSGNAFVEFSDRIDYERGMEYNMRHMGRRYIELIPLSKMEKFGPRAHSGGGPGFGSERNGPGPMGTNCISVKGLGPEVTSQDLKIYFGNAGARPFAVHIMLTPDQMNAGEAFLEFVDKESQKRALKRDGDIVGRDHISVRPVSYEMVMNALGRPMPPGSMAGAGGGGGPPPDFYNKGGRRGDKRGPPPPPFQDKSSILLALECSGKVKDEDFCVFFEKFKITPDRIKQRQNSDGTIDAQISFLSKADADHARRIMDGKYFLGRNIRLEPL